MIAISKAVIDLVEAAQPIPTNLADEAEVKRYLDGLTPGMAKLVAEIAQAVQSGKLGLIGNASADEVRVAVAEEIEARGLTSINPALIEAIITLVMTLIQLLAKR